MRRGLIGGILFSLRFVALIGRLCVISALVVGSVAAFSNASSASTNACPNTFHDNSQGGGANQSGPYDSTCDGSASQNGNGGNGNQPCAGCVGNADNQNPPCQLPGG